MSVKEPTTTNSNLPAIPSDVMDNLRDEMMGAIDARPPQIKVGSGESHVFVKPSTEETFKKIRCVILAANKQNNLYQPKDEGPLGKLMALLPDGFNHPDENVPICSGIGAKHGNRSQIKLNNGMTAFGPCAGCYFNQFKTDLKGGRGKACKNGRVLVLLLEGSSLPNRLSVPPTSIRNFDSFVTTLIDMKLPMPCVAVTMEIEKQKSGDGNPYSTIKFNTPTKDDILPEEQQREMIALHDKYMEYTQELVEDDDTTPDKPIETEVSFVDDDEQGAGELNL